jgi:hypothetical protein
MSVASLVGGKVAMGTLSRVVYCLLLQTAYDWPKALNARLRKKYEKNLKAWDGKLKKNKEKKYKAEGKKIQGKGNAGRPGLQGPVLRFFCIALFSSLFSFIFLKFSRFSLCSPSFYVPHSLSHRRFMYASMRRKRSLRADWGHFRSDGTPRGQHPP